MGGGNWGGVAFDPTLGLHFREHQQSRRDRPDGRSAGGAPMPYRPMAGYTRWIDKDRYPCQQPPWGELSAVNANTGDIAWRVPLGSYDPGMPNAGTPNLGGPIATAGGLVFIGATLDSKFRAFDSQTGRSCGPAQIDGSAMTVPMTYHGQGRETVRGDRGRRSRALPQSSTRRRPKERIR